MRNPPTSARLDRIFFALSDASRRDMLDRLSKAPACASDLALPLALGLPSVVKHLAVLEESGLIASEKEGRVRTYRIVPRALDGLEAWVLRRKHRVEAQFDRLDAYLRAQKEKASP